MLGMSAATHVQKRTQQDTGASKRAKSMPLKTFGHLTLPLDEGLLSLNEHGVIKLSAIDDRLPDVQISSERYLTFKNGRPNGAIDGGTTWVCKCRIAGIVYNRDLKNCGYCNRPRSNGEERATPWGLSGTPNWVIERIYVDYQQATSGEHRLHFPNRSVNMSTSPTIRSGALQVILMAVGYSWSISYRTAAIAFRWVGGGLKAQSVMVSLIASGELGRIRAEAARTYLDMPEEDFAEEAEEEDREDITNELQIPEEDFAEESEEDNSEEIKDILQIPKKNFAENSEEKDNEVIKDKLQHKQYQNIFYDLKLDREVVDLTGSDVDQQSNYASDDADTGQQQQEPSFGKTTNNQGVQLLDTHLGELLQPTFGNTTNDRRVQLLDEHLDKLMPITTNVAAQRYQRLNSTYCEDLRDLGIANPREVHPSVIQNHLIEILCDRSRSSKCLEMAGQLLRDNNKDIMDVYVRAHTFLEDCVKTRSDLCSGVPKTNDELLRNLVQIRGISL